MLHGSQAGCLVIVVVAARLRPRVAPAEAASLAVQAVLPATSANASSPGRSRSDPGFPSVDLRERSFVLLLEVPLPPTEAAVRTLRDLEHVVVQLREARLREQSKGTGYSWRTLSRMGALLCK